MKKVVKYFLPLVFMLFSCDQQVEYFITTEYQYSNSTASKVSLILYDQSNQIIEVIEIEPQQSHTDYLEAEGFEKGIVPPFSYSYGKTLRVVLKFESSNTCITYTNNQEILDYTRYDNYMPAMLSGNHNTLVFDIGSVEEAMAINCN
ncbi:hypothetical protein NZ698_07610 [Chryseobacterium sp. PBS4-4]|uniref:Lipoprotein n=1 Tax=Chryseobacterium edaphi TaxID=2976532 RepID=A0ABT2W8R7_9FLAO|nr:hypothetical protein [Chryseobacterium edaphi]MCU7617060.1 hypothetical protein [Chryseobacterium edaphi]